MYKSKPYLLQEQEEKIINLKDVTGVSALNSIYNILCSQFQFEFEGKKNRAGTIADVSTKSRV